VVKINNKVGFNPLMIVAADLLLPSLNNQTKNFLLSDISIVALKAIAYSMYNYIDLVPTHTGKTIDYLVGIPEKGMLLTEIISSISNIPIINLFEIEYVDGTKTLKPSPYIEKNLNKNIYIIDDTSNYPVGQIQKAANYFDCNILGYQVILGNDEMENTRKQQYKDFGLATLPLFTIESLIKYYQDNKMIKYWMKKIKS